jgi:biopolymer transport protein ExbD
MTESGEDVIVLQPAGDASVQRLIDVMSLFQEAGFTNLAILEAPQ